MHLLLIEDNADLAANIGEYLNERGHVVDYAADGLTGLHLTAVNTYDVLVLDLNLPGLDGVSLCKRLREDARNPAPVLMLTARETERDKLTGFEAGADDYLTKPFSLPELHARLKALARRAAGVTEILRVADLDRRIHRCLRRGRQRRARGADVHAVCTAGRARARHARASGRGAAGARVQSATPRRVRHDSSAGDCPRSTRGDREPILGMVLDCGILRPAKARLPWYRRAGAEQTNCWRSRNSCFVLSRAKDSRRVAVQFQSPLSSIARRHEEPTA